MRHTHTILPTTELCLCVVAGALGLGATQDTELMQGRTGSGTRPCNQMQLHAAVDGGAFTGQKHPPVH